MLFRMILIALALTAIFAGILSGVLVRVVVGGLAAVLRLL